MQYTKVPTDAFEKLQMNAGMELLPGMNATVWLSGR